jgi:hypothetical protein
MKKKTNNAIAQAIAERLHSDSWAGDLSARVEDSRRNRSRNRNRFLVAMAFFVIAGFLTTDELLDDDNDAENMYAMVEQVTLVPFAGRIVE